MGTMRDGSSCFAVKDSGVKVSGRHADFIKWLNSEGFQHGGEYFHLTDNPFVFINVDSRLYEFGVWGAPLYTSIWHNKPIDSEDFKAIYAILSKYPFREK